jgi:hypothetical protein
LKALNRRGEDLKTLNIKVFTEKDIKTAIDEKKKYVNDKIKDIFK